MQFTKIIITQNYFTSLNATHLHTRTVYNILIMHIHNNKDFLTLQQHKICALKIYISKFSFLVGNHLYKPDALLLHRESSRSALHLYWMGSYQGNYKTLQGSSNINKFPLIEKHGKLSFHTNLSTSLVYNCESGDVGSIPGCATNLQCGSEQVTYTKSLE